MRVFVNHRVNGIIVYPGVRAIYHQSGEELIEQGYDAWEDEDYITIKKEDGHTVTLVCDNINEMFMY